MITGVEAKVDVGGEKKSFSGSIDEVLAEIDAYLVSKKSPEAINKAKSPDNS
jgi:hypothetical protein